MDSAESRKMKISAEEKEKLKQRLVLLKKQYTKAQQKLQRVEKIDRIRSHVRRTIAEQNHLLLDGSCEEHGLEDGDGRIYTKNQTASRVGIQKNYQEKVTTVTFKSQPKVIELHNISESGAGKVFEPLTETTLEHILGDANTDSFACQSEARTGSELGNVPRCDEQTYADERNMRISKEITEQKTTGRACRSEADCECEQRSQTQGYKQGIQSPQGRKHDSRKGFTSWEISDRLLESENIDLQKKCSVKPTMSDSPCAVTSSQHKLSDNTISSSKARCSRNFLQSERAGHEVNCIHPLTSCQQTYTNSDECLPRQNERHSLLLKHNISASNPVQEYSRSNVKSSEPCGRQKIQDTTKQNTFSGNMKDHHVVEEVIGIENVSSISQEHLYVDNKPTEKINNEAMVKLCEATALENSETPELDINEKYCSPQGMTCTQSELISSGSEKHGAMEQTKQCSQMAGSSLKNKEHSLQQTQQNETCREANPEQQKCATEAHRTEPETSHTLVNGLPFPVEYYVRTTRAMASRRSQVDLHTVINNVLKTRRCEGGKGASRARVSRRKKIASGASGENTSPETELLFASCASSESSEKSAVSLPVTSESHPQLMEVSGLKSVLLNDSTPQTFARTPLVVRECLTDTEADCNTGVLKRHVLSIRRRGKVKGKKGGCRVSWKNKSSEPSCIQSLPLSITNEDVGASMNENTTVPLKIRDITKDMMTLGCHNGNGISIGKECSNVGSATARDSENQSEDLIPDTQCSTWSHAPSSRSSSRSNGSDTWTQGSPAATAQGQEEQGPTDFECPYISTSSQELTFSLGLVLSCLQTMCRRRVAKEFSLPDNEFAQLKRFHAQREIKTPVLTDPRFTVDKGEVKVKVALGIPCEEKCSVTHEGNSLAAQEDLISAKVYASSPDDSVTGETKIIASGDSKAQLSTTVMLSTPVESGQVQLDQMSALHVSPLPSVGFIPLSLCRSQACGSSQTSGMVKQLSTNPQNADLNGDCSHNPEVNKVKAFTHSDVVDASPSKGKLPPAVATASPGCHEGKPPVRGGAELSSNSSGAELQNKEYQDFVSPETLFVHPSHPDNAAAVVQMIPPGQNLHRDQTEGFAVLVSDGENSAIDATQSKPKQEFHWQLELMATIQCSGTGRIGAMCSGFWELQGHPCRCLIVAQKGLVSLWAEHWKDGQWQEIHTWVLPDETDISELLPIQDSLSPRLMAIAGSMRLLHVVGDSAEASQPLNGETLVAVVALRQQRVVCATRGRLGQTLTLLSFDEQPGIYYTSQLSTPDDDIMTLSDVSGEDEALIGFTESKDLFIWNVKSGHIICRISLTSLGPCSLCRRVVYDSGLLFAILSPKAEISNEEDGAEPSAFENVACMLAAINPRSRRACTTTHYKLPSGHTGGFVRGVLGGGALAAALTCGSLAMWDTCSGDLRAVWPPSSSGQRWAPLDWATVFHNHIAQLGNVEGSVKVFKCGLR